MRWCWYALYNDPTPRSTISAGVTTRGRGGAGAQVEEASVLR